MRTKTILVGALVTGVGLAGARLGARFLRDTVTTNSSTPPCFGLTWRAETTSRKGPFEDTPRIETTSVLESSGAPIAEDVREVKCRIGFAGVVVGAAQNEVRIYDTNSGALVRKLSFDAPISSTRWPRDGDSIAVELEPNSSDGGAGNVRLQVIDARGAAPARTIREDAHLTSGYAWSPTGKKLCWTIAERPASGAGSVDLECWTSDAMDGGNGAITKVTHAVQSDGDSAVPWVGFVVDEPHLCGLGISPRDIECDRLTRSDDE